jgi:hypothetical protein
MQSASLLTAGIVIPGRWLPGARATDLAPQPIEQFDYGDVARKDRGRANQDTAVY